MALLGQLKRRLGRAGSAHDESDLRGNDILLEMARDRGSVKAKADKGLEERAARSLEDSYVPETIDIGSVRPLSKLPTRPSPPEQKTTPPPKQEAAPHRIEGEVQLELDIGDSLRKTPPFGRKVDLGRVADHDWKRVADGYLIPWVRRREGLASYEEIQERLERTSFDLRPEMSKKLRESLPLAFIKMDDDIYALDEAVEQNSRRVLEKAASYFYQEGLNYPFRDLVYWIEKEFALSWEGVSNAFIGKCLSLSSRFSIYRHPSAELYIRMS